MFENEKNIELEANLRIDFHSSNSFFNCWRVSNLGTFSSLINK